MAIYSQEMAGDISQIEKVYTEVISTLPSIQNENIRIIQGNFKTTLQARPALKSLFGEREYVIRLNVDCDFGGPLFDDLSPRAQIGIMAHELSHIVDYSNKTNWEIFLTGLKYLTTKGKRVYERKIDAMTIELGFRSELKEWATYSMNNDRFTQKYRDFKRNTYLTPVEIENYVISKHAKERLLLCN